jgi:hypothetical protein
MRRTRRAAIPQRRRIFLGCEGESERSYGTLLARLIEVRHRRIHLDTVLLRPGGGDPLALIELAIRRMHERAARGDDYVAKAVLLDGDTRGRSPFRDRTASVLAGQHGLRLIWQEPCHEGLLLRHLDGCDALRPPTSRAAMAELQRRWPDYYKAAPAVRLATRIDEQGVLRAAAVETELRTFLAEIEFGSD